MCHKAPKAKPRRSQPCPFDNPTRPCDSPHVPMALACAHGRQSTSTACMSQHVPMTAHVLVQMHTPGAPSDKRQAPSTSATQIALVHGQMHMDLWPAYQAHTQAPMPTKQSPITTHTWRRRHTCAATCSQLNARMRQTCASCPNSLRSF